MTKLSPAEVYQLCTQAGFDPVKARIMTAIAGAESGYVTDKLGDRALEDAKWGPSVGLFQIRTLKAQTGTGKERDINRLLGSVLWQAMAAHTIYVSSPRGFGEWSTYTNQSYRGFLGDAMDAATKTEVTDATGGTSPLAAATGALGGALYNTGGAVVDAAAGTLTGINAVGHFFAALSQHATWVRVLQVVGGTALIAGGLAVMGHNIAAPVASLAMDATPQGRALSAGSKVLRAGEGAKTARTVAKAARTSKSAGQHAFKNATKAATKGTS